MALSQPDHNNSAYLVVLRHRTESASCVIYAPLLYDSSYSHARYRLHSYQHYLTTSATAATTTTKSDPQATLRHLSSKPYVLKIGYHGILQARLPPRNPPQNP